MEAGLRRLAGVREAACVVDQRPRAAPEPRARVEHELDGALTAYVTVDDSSIDGGVLRAALQDLLPGGDGA